jgi:hypothetical protein
MGKTVRVTVEVDVDGEASPVLAFHEIYEGLKSDIVRKAKIVDVRVLKASEES